MCIITDDVEVATEDIKVYKVMIAGETPFQGGGKRGLGFDTLGHVIRFKAKGFDDGFGYSAFPTEKQAKTYCNKLVNGRGQAPKWFNVNSLNFRAKKPDVVPLKIPKGSRYAGGKIEMGCYGAFLPALRCEKLRRLEL